MDNSSMTLKPWKKHIMTILLMGECGVGKTAFLNLLVNVCKGRKLEEFKIDVMENESTFQTNQPLLHRIICPNGCEVRVLDTPGLGHPQGTHHDDMIQASIVKTIKDEIDSIDSVLILVNGAQARRSIYTQYVMSIISAMLPHSIVSNIGFVFTRVASPLYFNFDRDALTPSVLRSTKMWTIDNPLVCWSKYQDTKDTSDDILEEMRETAFLTYNKTLKTLNGLFEWQDERVLSPTKAIIELQEMSIKTEALINNILARFQQAEERRSQLQKIQRAIELHKQDSAIKEGDEKAKFEEERMVSLEKELDNSLTILQKSTEMDEDAVGLLCMKHAELALSGSFLDYITRAIWLQRMRYEKGRNEGVVEEVLQHLDKSITSLQNKKDLLERVTKGKGPKQSEP